MAKFNQDIPTPSGDPNYLGYTRPLSSWDIGVDRTEGTITSGVGDILKNVVTGADEILSSLITTGIRKDAEAERATQTAAVETGLGLSPMSPQPSYSAPSGAPSATDIIPGSVAAPVPAALQSFEKTVSGPATGLVTKPGLNSYYEGKLDTIAQDYRARYGEGYADLIDKTMEKVTGMIPANKRLQDLEAMFQKLSTNAQAEQKEAMAFIAKNDGIPGSAEFMKNIVSGKTDGLSPMTYAMSKVAPFAQADRITQKSIQENTKFEGDHKVLVAKNMQDATGIATSLSNTVYTQAIENTGMTPSKLEEVASKIQSGQLKIDPQIALAYGNAASLAGDIAWKQVEKRLDATGPDGKSMSQIIGPTNKEQLHQDVIHKYVELSKRFSDPNTGIAFQDAKWLTVHTNSTSRWLLEESDSRDLFSAQAAITKNGGAAAGGLMMEKILQNYTQIQDTLKAYGQLMTNKMAAFPGNPLDLTLDQLMKKKVGASVISPPADRDIYKYLTTDVPAMLVDPNLDAASKTTLAGNIFSGNAVDKFDNDQKHGVLSSMTKTEIADSVWNLAGKSAQSPLWLQYKNWVSTNTRLLLKDDVHNIQELEAKGNASFTWNPKVSKVEAAPSAGQTDLMNPFMSPTEVMRRFDTANLPNIIPKINTALQPFIDIAKKEGLDPNLYVANQLQNLGIDPASKLMQSITGAKEGETPSSTKPKASSDTPITDAMFNLPDKVRNMIQSGSLSLPESITGLFSKGMQSAIGSIDRAGEVIKNRLESGGDYNAIGNEVTYKNGEKDHAYGAYQVMGKNIPAWTLQYYGRVLTPQEFLKDRKAQDAVFHGEFGRLMIKHGAEGAARAWYAGEEGMNNLNATDVNKKLTVSAYGKKFAKYFSKND